MLDLGQKSLTILVVGLMQSDNLGDMVIAEVIAQRLKKRGCTVRFLDISGSKLRPTVKPRPHNNYVEKGGSSNKNLGSSFSKITKPLFSMLAWNRPKHRETRDNFLAEVRECDIAIIGGGQLITDGSAPRIISIIDSCRKSSKPFVFFSVGISSDLSWLAKKTLRRFMSKASWSSARSEDCSIVLKELCATAHSKITPDPAILSLSCFDMGGIANQADCKRVATVGLNIQNLVDMRSYLDKNKITYGAFISKIINLVKDASLAGYNVEIFTNGNISDQHFAEFIYRAVAERGHNVRLASRPKSTKELVSLIAHNEFNICFRLHAAILSYAFRVPFICFPWDTKVSRVLREIGEEARVIDPSFWCAGSEFSIWDKVKMNERIASNPVTAELIDTHIDEILQCV